MPSTGSIVAPPSKAEVDAAVAAAAAAQVSAATAASQASSAATTAAAAQSAATSAQSTANAAGVTATAAQAAAGAAQTTANTGVTNAATAQAAANAAFAAIPLWKSKAADQQVPAGGGNNTTLVDDTHLQFTLPAGATCQFQGVLAVTTGAVLEGLKIAFAGSVGVANLVVEVFIISHDAVPLSVPGRVANFGSPVGTAPNFNGNFSVRFAGTIETSSGGTFILRIAKQGTTGATATTFRRGSWMKVRGATA